MAMGLIFIFFWQKSSVELIMIGSWPVARASAPAPRVFTLKDALKFISMADLGLPLTKVIRSTVLQSCARGGRRRVEDMCYERRRAEACVDESAHHALVNAGGNLSGSRGTQGLQCVRRRVCTAKWWLRPTCWASTTSRTPEGPSMCTSGLVCFRSAFVCRTCMQFAKPLYDR